MLSKSHGAHEISESEFNEANYGRDDAICLEYDEFTGTIRENGYVDIDQEDEEIIGRAFIDSFIDSGKEIAWGRNDESDTNYEFTRWNSKGKKR